MNKLLIIDGQGGGIGKVLIEQLKQAYPALHITAVGTNTMATAAMMRAGADAHATGENAVVVCTARAELIAGPVGIVMPNAMLGELSPRMAEAVSTSGAPKVLVPVSKCNTFIAGASDRPLAESVAQTVALIGRFLKES